LEHIGFEQGAEAVSAAMSSLVASDFPYPHSHPLIHLPPPFFPLRLVGWSASAPSKDPTPSPQP
jgi:hypothetical protein